MDAGQRADSYRRRHQRLRPHIEAGPGSRVAYLTTDMLKNVINHGTGEKVRALGFTSPAAGKTGTSHDAWFAGSPATLLCIVWVGNDDYTDLKIEGADAAAPIWAEFMKKAVLLPQYSDTNEFTAPDGVQIVQIDKVSNLLSDETCPDSYGRGVFSMAPRRLSRATIRPIGAIFLKKSSDWQSEK